MSARLFRGASWAYFSQDALGKIKGTRELPSTLAWGQPISDNLGYAAVCSEVLLALKFLAFVGNRKSIEVSRSLTRSGKDMNRLIIFGIGVVFVSRI